MGSVFGARLQDAGHKTTLIDVSEPLVRKICADGLTVIRDGSETLVEISASTEVGAVDDAMDVVIFFVKCYHTAQAAESARPLIGSKTLVASLQNGWGNGDVLAAAFDPKQIVVGVTYNSATVRDLGVVAHTNEGATIIGPYTGDTTAVASPLADALSDAGFAVTATPNVKAAIWKKLVLNAATLPTAALTGLTGGELVLSQEMLDLVDAVTREAVAAAQAVGIDLDADEQVENVLAICERVGPGKASMLQDVEAGRRTEIDVITGAVVRAAKTHRVAVPANEALYALVTGFERARGLR